MSATDRFPPPHLIPEDEGSERKGAASKINESTQSPEQQQLALPAAGSKDTENLDVSGSDEVKHTFRFDNLGPLVVNKDGTLSRIHNWSQMTDAERERTVRVLGKRNMLRKEAILKDEEADD